MKRTEVTPLYPGKGLIATIIGYIGFSSTSHLSSNSQQLSAENSMKNQSLDVISTIKQKIHQAIPEEATPLLNQKKLKIE